MSQRDGRGNASATIYDVARDAGVSISTVSLALNSPGRVRPATLEKVYAAVRERGFQPKAEAVARARKSSRRIGVKGAFTTHGSFLERLQGVLMAAEEDHYEIVVYNDESMALGRHFIDRLVLNGQLEGIILIGVPMTDALAEHLLQEAFKTVLVGYGRPGFSCVDVDDVEGGRLAAEYLVQRGYQRCAYLGLPAPVNEPEVVPLTPEEWRLDGFRSCLTDAGIALPDKYMLAKHSFGAAEEAVHHLLSLDEAPDAIFASADDLAGVVLKVARQRGLRVPEDVAVMGFDDREFADHLGLTTIRQSLVESGRVALRLLQDRFGTTSPGATTTVVLPLTVIPRSTA